MTELPVRFASKIKVDAGDTCWIWTATTDKDGYGRFWWAGKVRKAHRVSYELHVGSIPDGLVIDHLCRVRSCVNPDHLRAVTVRENTHAPGSLALNVDHVQRTHCPRGHRHAKWNVVASHARLGWRKCLSCDRAHAWGQRRGLRMTSPEVHAEAVRHYAQLQREANRMAAKAV